MTWVEDAECRDEYEFTNWPTAMQLTYCKDCPVREQCLREALLVEINDTVLPTEGWPVRGGLTGQQRRLLIERPRNRPAPIKHGTPGGYRSHLRHGSESCEPCRRAEATACAERKQRRAAA